MCAPLLMKHERTAAAAKMKLSAGRKPTATTLLHAITPTGRTTSEEKLKQLLGREIVAAKVHAGTTGAAAAKRIVLWRTSHTFGTVNVVNLLLLRIREHRKGFADLFER